MRGFVVALGIVVATLVGACVDTTWREGIPCGANGTCPDGMRCCGNNACYRRCAVDDAAPPMCSAPLTPSCIDCRVGCPCRCGTIDGVCCPAITGSGTLCQARCN